MTDSIRYGGESVPHVGFSILSHGNPEQLRRLIQALDREYDRPAIACHHDFGQAALDPSQFGENVEFVRPHIATGWARYSLVQATLAAIELLYRKQSPDWFVHLSAADYPVMAGEQVRRLLADTDCDAFLDARPINPSAKGAACIKGSQNPKLNHFNNPGIRRIKRLFYTSREIWIPIVRLKPKIRLGRISLRPGWPVGDVYDDFPCFFGDFWFVGNAATAQTLLEPSETHLRLRRHLQTRTQTDETYFQTVLMNAPQLNICLDNKRFAEWNGGGAHPMVIGIDQVDEMLGSGAFFARKFAHQSPVLDVIDRSLAPRPVV